VLITKKIKFLSNGAPEPQARLRPSGVSGSVTRGNRLRYGRRISTILTLLAVLGCGSSERERTEDYLLRLGEFEVTRHEFMQAFELAKAAHPGSTDSDSPELQQARRRLRDEMSIDLILLQRSRELGVTVSAAELEAAVNAVKADYPPGVFEQTFVESALPFEAWKQRLGSRLLMDKLVEVELQPHVTISAEDLAVYYAQNYGGKAAGADTEQKFERLKETLVADLHRAKTEEAFSAWIDGLRSRYPVEVNASAWERITAAGPPAATPPTEGGETGK
jgi:hypothetical protein